MAKTSQFLLENYTYDLIAEGASFVSIRKQSANPVRVVVCTDAPNGDDTNFLLMTEGREDFGDLAKNDKVWARPDCAPVTVYVYAA